MNKVLCVFLAIVFVCSVFAYGTNKRFSVAVWIDNVLSIGQGVQLQDIADTWRKDEVYIESALNADSWEQIYTKETDIVGNPVAFAETVSLGYLPIAYDANGERITKDVDHQSYVYRVDANGIPILNPYYDGDDFMERHYWWVFTDITDEFESYEGDNDLYEFFDNIRGFFLRVARTAQLIGRMILQVFENVGKLLPWNATVEVT